MTDNVIPIRSHIRGAGGALRKVADGKLTEYDMTTNNDSEKPTPAAPNYVSGICRPFEEELDAIFASHRADYEACEQAAERASKQSALRRALSRPSVIPLDSSLWARAIRWVRWALRLRGPL